MTDRLPNGRFPPGNGYVHKPSQGAGYGGEANGAGWGGTKKPYRAAQFTSENQPSLQDVAAGRDAAKTATDAAKPHAAKMVDIWLEIAQDPAAPAMARIAAAEKLVDRAEGKPKQTNEQTGPNGGAMVTEVVYRWADSEPEGEA